MLFVCVLFHTIKNSCFWYKILSQGYYLQILDNFLGLFKIGRFEGLGHTSNMLLILCWFLKYILFMIVVYKFSTKFSIHQYLRNVFFYQKIMRKILLVWHEPRWDLLLTKTNKINSAKRWRTIKIHWQLGP